MSLGLLLNHGQYGFHTGTHIAVALALLALVAGFFACAKAQCLECVRCKRCGTIIGWFTMAIAVLLLACLAWRCWTVAQCHDEKGKACPYSHDGGHDHGEHHGEPSGETEGGGQ